MKNISCIIYFAPRILDKECETKFYKTQLQLIKMGFDVINPLKKTDGWQHSATRSKEKKLVQSNVI